MDCRVKPGNDEVRDCVPGAMRHFRDAEHRGHAASQNPGFFY
jgi:hypothetical protein